MLRPFSCHLQIAGPVQLAVVVACYGVNLTNPNGGLNNDKLAHDDDWAFGIFGFGLRTDAEYFAGTGKLSQGQQGFIHVSGAVKPGLQFALGQNYLLSLFNLS